ncbi:retropepsin-like aspartic protease family protein [Sphingomonas baiyangensis]|uniref:TIGR02281 family clan AA aspartic protease n=1 Tax=Sphingomonas baiyangensis TaxID=2572576 RepID=A0A4U1L102_9SPHN|nr:TIGR02281 family clan AA aspartic protease [Sphingomonas baiyangensis]TKD50449.1 TIGR02281 family clan AA aspartic protease [Sphingomonas baiyangensis]
MSGDDMVRLLMGVGVLVLALSALSLRRMSFGMIVRSVLGWVAIIAIVYAAVLHRDAIEAVLTDLGDRAGLSDQEMVGDTVRIRQSPNGHFYARVTINGVEQRMLVDSGATITALSEATARAAGIDTSGGFPVLLTTANGTIAAQRGIAERVTVGSLATEDLPVVVSANFGDVNVIGMNFLSRLGSWRVEGRTLILEPPTAR